MIRPVFDNVIVKKIEDKNETASGIVLPAMGIRGKDEANIGEIYAIGEASVLAVESGGELQKGDKVIFSDNYKKVNYKNETYYVLNEEELLAILN